MILSQCRFLTDENIHPAVAEHLRSLGLEVYDVKEERLIGCSDEELMRDSHSQKRAIITHDRDFGRLAIVKGIPFWGIVYLRPGHLRVPETISVLNKLLAWTQEVEPPFLLVCEQWDGTVRIRLRNLPQT